MHEVYQYVSEHEERTYRGFLAFNKWRKRVYIVAVGIRMTVLYTYLFPTELDNNVIFTSAYTYTDTSDH